MKRMDQNNLKVEASLEEIRNLLSHLHGEITVLEESYTQVLQVLRKFEEIAEIDDLTGLLRRKAFFRRWDAILGACEKLNENCGVILIDIDHFKKINDTAGHAVGDEVLRIFAERMTQNLRSFDLVARLGGEEFVVLLPATPATRAFVTIRTPALFAVTAIERATRRSNSTLVPSSTMTAQER